MPRLVLHSKVVYKAGCHNLFTAPAFNLIWHGCLMWHKGLGGEKKQNGFEWSYSEMLTICGKDFKAFKHYFIFFPAPESFILLMHQCNSYFTWHGVIFVPQSCYGWFFLSNGPHKAPCFCVVAIYGTCGQSHILIISKWHFFSSFLYHLHSRHSDTWCDGSKSNAPNCVS